MRGPLSTGVDRPYHSARAQSILNHVLEASGPQFVDFRAQILAITEKFVWDILFMMLQDGGATPMLTLWEWVSDSLDLSPPH